MATIHPTISVVKLDDTKTKLVPVEDDAANLTLYVVTDGTVVPYTGTVWGMTYDSGGLGDVSVPGEYRLDVTQAGLFQSVIGSSSTDGAMVKEARWRNDPGLAGVNTVTVTVTDDADAVLQGVLVTVHNDAQTDAGFSQITDADGNAVFGLDDGDYQVVLPSTPSYTPVNPYPLTVSGTTALTCEMTTATITAPSASNYLVYGYEPTLDGNTMAAASAVKVTIVACDDKAMYTASDGTIRRLLGTEYSTNSAGLWSFQIDKNAVASGGSITIEREFTNADGNTVTRRLWAVMDDSVANADDQIAFAAWSPSSVRQ